MADLIVGGNVRMTQFVNYKKRSFKLPPGCKNLIDVLERSRRQTNVHMATADFQPLEIREERFHNAGMAQVGRYVSMLLQSRGEIFTLSVTAQDFQFPVTLYRSRSEHTAAIIVLVAKDAHREQTVRAFFEQHGIEALALFPDFGGGDAPRGLVYPLPSDAPRATSLTTELLRSVYGLSEEAGLDFRYYEVETAA